MAEAVFRVAHAGPHVTIQDSGRPGLMRYGVPASGAMDRKALAIANLALGNAAGAPGIEISPGGLALDCLGGAVTVAVAGGGFVVELDGRKAGSWSVFEVQAGQRLALRLGPWGSWACLAFAGRLVAREWLGSVATHAPSGLGGGTLAAGRELRIAGAERRPGRAGAIPCPVWARPRRLLHAVAGPQEGFFGAGGLDLLATATFRLSPAFNRMGARLDGPALPPENALGIPSGPILRGSVQVAGDGRPTLLLADHQTTGGYPRIATVLDDDLDGLVQCRPGDPIRFRLIDAGVAVTLARQRARVFDRYVAALTRCDKVLDNGEGEDRT